MYPNAGYNSSVTKVFIGSRARKQLKKVPQHVVSKLKVWVGAVQQEGLDKVRRLPGFHDEPLQGKRRGQRSIRLSRAYRAIYSRRTDGGIDLVTIEEVNKHDY